MAGRRRKPPRPDPNLVQSDQQDGLCWPTLGATWEGLSDQESEGDMNAPANSESRAGALWSGDCGVYLLAR